MHPDLLRCFKSGAPEHCWPEDGVESIDVLADDVQVGRPPRRTSSICREACAGEVVDQRVVPDVDGPRLRITLTRCGQRAAAVFANWEWDPPRCPFAADGEIFQTLSNESEHLVATVFGLHGRWVLRKPGLEALLVGAELKEPVALGEPLQRDPWMVRADRLVALLRHIVGVAEPFVGAVPALVTADVDVAGGKGSSHHLLCGEGVVRVGGANEPVGTNQQLRLARLEEGDLRVDEGLWAHPLLCGAGGDVDRVLVGTREEADLVAAHAAPAGDRIGANHLIERVQARLVVGIRDGRC